MKKYLAGFFIFTSIFIKHEKCFASHTVGADLTYACMGGNNYRFFLTLYRDCSGIAISPTYTIAGYSTCGGSTNIIVSLDSTNEVKHTCPSVVTKCINPASPYMGIESNYYHGDITLPSVCNYWTFGLSPAICNRNAAINNLLPNGSTYCLYVEAMLDNSVFQCNNSPVFSSQAAAFLCADQVQYYRQQVIDADNDSLRFQMYTPHSDAVSDVQYYPGLSGTQPVSYVTDSTRFDTTNGEIRFLADGPQITVVAIRVSDYRNGVFIGSVERDMQLVFENCSGVLPNPPEATGINGTADFSTHICYDSLFTFQFYTTDPDSDSTFISWDQGIQSATLTTVPGVFQTGVFSWHPDTFDIQTSPHTFTVYITDNSCPALSQSIYSFQIFVDSCHAISKIDNPQNFIKFFSAYHSSESHSIHFKYKISWPGTVSILLHDLTGRLVKSERIQESSASDGKLDAFGLSPGMYLLSLKTVDGISQSVKVVIE